MFLVETVVSSRMGKRTPTGTESTNTRRGGDQTDRHIRRRFWRTKIDHSSIRQTTGVTLLLAVAITSATATLVHMNQVSFLALVAPLTGPTNYLIHPTLLVYLPLIAIVIGGIIHTFGKLSWRDMGLVREDLPLGLAVLIISWLAMQGVSALVVVSRGGTLQLPSTWASMGALFVLGDFFGQLFGNALYEEVVFRSVLMVQFVKMIRARWSGLSPRSSFLIALLGSQLLFALIHVPDRLASGVPLAQLVGAIILPLFFGILLVLVYYRTGNIFVAIVLHTFINTPTMVVGTNGLGQVTALGIVLVIVIGWPYLDSGRKFVARARGSSV